MLEISKNIQRAKQLLNQEEIVAIPTETVYGLAGNIYSEKAIRSIFKIKERPFFNPLIVHIHSIDQLDSFATEIPLKAIQLAQKFWPGSLTLVLKKKSVISDLISAGKDTVAVRIPNHQLTLELLRELDFPLAAPSANPFGCISPTHPKHVVHYFKNDLKLVLDGGQCENGIESTIIGFEEQNPVLYRLGSLSLEKIEAEIGPVRIKNKSETNSPEAPGMLSKHYAPKTKTILTNLIHEEIKSNQGKKIGIVAYKKIDYNIQPFSEEILSEKGDIEEAMRNLYAAMHRLDSQNLDVIIAEKFPDSGVGKSINDRLIRATKN